MDWSRRVAMVVSAFLLLGAASAVYAGIPKVPKGNQQNNGTNGPYGLPPLKKVAEACMLTHDEEQSVLRVYDEYKHKEHEEKQSKTASGSTGLQDCISAVKKDLTPDQQKKFDELLNDKGKKKKN